MWILCLAEDSYDTSSLIFTEKKYSRLSPAVVVTGTLTIKRIIDFQKVLKKLLFPQMSKISHIKQNKYSNLP